MDSKLPEFEDAQQLVEAPPLASAPSPQPADEPSKHPTARQCLVRRLVIGLLLFVVLLPPAAGFYSFVSGVPLHLLASDTTGKLAAAPSAAASGVALAPGQLHTVDVTDGVCSVLGIRKPGGDAIAVVEPPTKMRPLVLPGSTALDPARMRAHSRSIRAGSRG